MRGRFTGERIAASAFAFALFSSAALIFVLQPLFARLVTPLLGGSPQVWNTSMAFFQMALLAGYLYAHLLTRISDIRVQALAHLAVLAGAWFALPIGVTTAFGPPDPEHPSAWLFGVMSLSVGAPFAAASATAPLLQSWFARISERDSYPLYAASNLGSFVGLLGYPTLIEPLLGVRAQSAAWSMGYLLVVALILAAASIAVRAPARSLLAAGALRSAPPGWRRRAYWVVAAALPSAMSLGVTLHISTDIASAPLLWVIPLALYLLTFVIAFARAGAKSEAHALFLHPLALGVMAVSYFSGGSSLLSLGAVLLGYFFSALVCHLALARSRPEPDRLTEYYLFLSLGGVLGGAFAALAAPLLFNNVYELALALGLGCALRPRQEPELPRLANVSLISTALLVAVTLALLVNALPVGAAMVVFAAIGAAAAALAPAFGRDGGGLRYVALAIAAAQALALFAAILSQSEAPPPWLPLSASRLMLQATSLLSIGVVLHYALQARAANRLSDAAHGAALPAAALALSYALAPASFSGDVFAALAMALAATAFFFNRGRPATMAAAALAAFALVFAAEADGGAILTQERTFFGVLRTRELSLEVEPGRPAQPMRTLAHGTTLHGAQLVGRTTPLTYYHPRTALGEAVLARLSSLEAARVGLIGLGTGSTACLTEAGDRLTVYEIDPAVVALSARPGGDFTYMALCQPNARIELGDARLRIAQAPNGAFDVIVVDAFSSDAIPTHLLTREAVELYLSKLSEQGIVVLHLSNRNLALVSEAARVARDLGAPSLYRINAEWRNQAGAVMAYRTSVLILARHPQTLATLPLASEWRVLAAPEGRAWSDDYVNVARAIWRNVSGAEECWLEPAAPRCQQN